MKLNKLSKSFRDMPVGTSLAVITDNNSELSGMIVDVLEVGSQILGTGVNAYYGILSVLDAMEIYGEDLNTLFTEICCYYEEWLLTIIWSLEVAEGLTQLNKEIPEFAKIDFIKKIISETGNFPFEEAKEFIESNSSLSYSMRV
jgi:hypothetical protein